MHTRVIAAAACSLVVFISPAAQAEPVLYEFTTTPTVHFSIAIYGDPPPNIQGSFYYDSTVLSSGPTLSGDGLIYEGAVTNFVAQIGPDTFWAEQMSVQVTRINESDHISSSIWVTTDSGVVGVSRNSYEFLDFSFSLWGSLNYLPTLDLPETLTLPTEPSWHRLSDGRIIGSVGKEVEIEYEYLPTGSSASIEGYFTRFEPVPEPSTTALQFTALILLAGLSAMSRWRLAKSQPS